MSEQSSPRVVCIEDEPTMIDLIRLILTGRGYHFAGAMGGQEGLELIETFKPDVVLLDLMMPDMSGWDVFQKMKASEAMQNIPVIIVTAKAQHIDRVLGLHVAKVEEYLTKPFSPAELISAIERVLSTIEPALD